MNTYQSFYQNEVRALELTINDQDGYSFSPSGAYTQIKTDAGVQVIEEQAAMVYDNKIRTLIGTTVTFLPGKYKVIWKIKQAGHSFYHITILEVQEL